ncbi:uncharacterized protein LOC106753514 [Vigna radiata var. radiata]|uniref:Uncharacterized protein LOC106753514 n=1 Tax=Vigna radiata var. radiata TaxID=3916 RepID=A0A1S3TAN0_VIGRR|nr:uncharacterized protein LOC106753514 [Vigna radiata var. radiata]
MAFRTGCDAIWCRAFSLSLEGEALKWFDSLPNGTIENFKSLSNMFKSQFAACRVQDATIVDLMNLKQGKEETLKTFMDRFQKIVRRVKGLSTKLALQHVMPGLRPGPFKDSICRKPPKTMEELRQRTADEIRVEDMKQNYRKELQEMKAEKQESRRDGQSGRPGNAKGREGPRNLRFPQYTQLNAPRARILQESLSAQIMQIPQQRPTPPGADNSKHCMYHQNMGHNTEDYVTLKDKIEEMVRAGLLQRYVKGYQSGGSPDRWERKEYMGRSSPRYEEKRKYTRSPSQFERKNWSSDGRGNRYAGHGRNDAQRRSRSRSQERGRSRPLRGVINTISGRFAGGGQSSSTRKRSIRTLRSTHGVEVLKRTMLPITFTDEDFHAPDPEQDDPMVITVEIAQYEISKVLVDQGSSVNILYWKTFQQMDISEDLIVPFGEQLVGFAGERVDTQGYLDLRIRLGTNRSSEEKKVRFLLVEANTSYNALLGRPCLNLFGAIVSTPHLTLKYPTSHKTICTVRADQKTIRECYAAGLKMFPREVRRRTGRSEVAMTDLDPRTNTDDRLEPIGETLPVIIGPDPTQTTLIAQGMDPEIERRLKATLWHNRDLFAWTATDLPGIHPSVMSHRLSLCKEARPVAQKKRKMGEEKRKAVET